MTVHAATPDESYRLYNNHGSLSYANGTPVQLVGTNLGYGGDVWGDIADWCVESNKTYDDAMTDLSGRGVNAIRIQVAPFYYRYNTYVDPKNPYNMPASVYYTNNSVNGVTVAQHWASYDSVLDSIVNSATKHGMYVIIDTHASGSPESYDPILNGTNLKYAMASGYAPNQSNLIWLWKRIAPRYAGNPFVIYEPYNEVWSVDGASWQRLQPYDQTILNTIREAGARKTLVVMTLPNGGSNSAFNKGTNNPLTLPLSDSLSSNPLDNNNIVYSIHEYNASDVAAYGYGNWDSNLPLLDHYPLFLGEWSDYGGSASDVLGGNDSNYVEPLMNWSINYHVAPFFWSYVSFFDHTANPGHSWYYGSSLPYTYANSYMTKYDLPFVSAANYTNSVPTSAFTIDHTTVVAPGAVHVEQHASGRPVKWVWNWGDGTSTTVKIGDMDSNQRAAITWNYADHTYNKTGVYPITLTVSNSKGSTTSNPTYITATGNGPTPTQTPTPTPTQTPTPTSYTFSLGRGWNMVSLPVQNGSFWASNISSSGGVDKVSVFNGNTQSFSNYIVGVSGPDKNIQFIPDTGYFINCTRPTTLTLKGVKVDGPRTLTLNPGWNMIGWTPSYNSTAKTFGSLNPHINKISKFSTATSLYTTYIVGASPDDKNFQMTNGNGYFVYNNATTTITVKI